MIAGELTVGRRAAAWIVEHASYFTSRDDRRREPQLVGLAELGLFIFLSARAAADAADVESARAVLASAFDEAAFAEAVREDRRLLASWLTVLIGLDERARAKSGAREIVLGPNAFATEQYPHRVLETIWAAEKLGWHSPFAPAAREVYGTTFLARPHDLATALPADTYAVTHTVGYLTDFGARVLLDDAAAQRHAEAVVRRLLDRALEWEHYDLVAELLAALRWLGSTRDDLQSVAWERLAAQQLPSGAVVSFPAGPGLLAELAAGDVGSIFGLVCHPTLVTALAEVS